MRKIPGYTIKETLENSRSGFVYRATTEHGNTTVIIKVLKTAYLSASEIARFKREYELIRKSEAPGIIKTLDLKDHNGTFALVLEDCSGVPLGSFMQARKIELKTFLDIAIQLAETLGHLHKSGVIHRNITSYSILFDVKKGKVKMTDFGAVAELTRENDDIYDPGVIREFLAYMSPEQTGRMNRTIDYRTDLYSLGIVFYEMLTGRIPFESSDPLGMIYSHIARRPLRPSGLVNDLPRPISDMVMKLLCKSAEDRYQNAFGLMTDLRECLERLEKTGRINPFKIARRDISMKFKLPETIVGRKREAELLLSAFDRVSRGEKEMALVSGEPGIGKSALINEMLRPTAARKGYFISGKCEPLRRDVPYSSVIQAFQGLIRQILTESRQRLDVWRRELQEVLGSNGKVIADVIPEIELIIGKQRAVLELGPDESINRFNRIFKGFTRVFAQREHPLVLFLDDVQWADSAGLHLIENLINAPDIRFLFLICAYRDGEVTDTHPVRRMLTRIEQQDIHIDNVCLSVLSVSDTDEMMADFLRNKRSIEFSEVVQKKTGGNPFFVKQFLEMLYRESLLKLDPAEGWRWDLDKIEQAQVTDNVVDLMVAKIVGLPPGSRKMLEICACIGNRFEPETISRLLDESVESTMVHLNEAISLGLINRSDGVYMFHHDRIHEAAYLLIPEERRIRLHHHIGKIFLEQKDEAELGDKIYYIVNQLNIGRKLLRARERVQLARLNLKAGLKAKKSAAYDAADGFLRRGMELLPPDRWDREYDLSLSLYLERGETAYLTNKPEEAELIFKTVLGEAKTPLDKTRVYEVKISTYTALHQYRDALELGKIALKKLGVGIPEKITRLHVAREFLRARVAMKHQAVEDLIRLPKLSDPRKLATARILMACVQPSYIRSPECLIIVILKLLNLTLKHGNSSYAAYAYAAYAAALCGIFGKIDQGYRFGRLALRLLDQYKAVELRCSVYFILGNYVTHWKEPAAESLKYFIEAYRTGYETGGDLTYTSMSLLHRNLVPFWSGNTIAHIISKLEKDYPYIKQLQHVRSIQAYELWYHLMLNFSTPPKDVRSLSARICDDRQIWSEWVRVNNRTALGYFTVVKQAMSYICGDFKEAVNLAREAKGYLESIYSTIFVVEHFFYQSLALLAGYPDAEKTEQKAYLKQVGKNQKKMRKWAAHAPCNFADKYFLVEAELSRINGRAGKALRFYKKAMSLAGQNGFIMEEAMAKELTAVFCLSMGMREDAGRYVREARYGFERWGARVKVEQLDEKYRDLLKLPREEKAVTFFPKLDHAAVVSSLQAISTEIIPDALLRTLMSIVVEDAGAEKGFFISVRRENLFLEAKASIGQEEVALFRSVPVEASCLALSVANYVRQTRQVVVLDDATTSAEFGRDEYILRNHPKSVLCLPVVRQSELVGLLYLENNVATRAFTPDRIEVLKLLSAQAAISFENARLYESVVLSERALKESEEKHRTILESIEDGYYEVDTSGHFTLVNDSLCKILGYSRGELLGMNYRNLMREESAEEIRETFRRVLETGNPVTGFDNEFTRKDGVSINNELSVSLIRDPKGKKTGFRGIVRDITERKKIAKELKSINKKLRREIKDRKLAEEEANLRQEQLFQAAKMASLGTLVSGVAHEINNPMSFITLNAPILQKTWQGVTPILDKHSEMRGDFTIANVNYGELRERIPLILSGIVEGGKRVKAIVRDLKEFARQSPPKLADSVDINEVTRTAVGLVGNLINKSTNKFSEDYGPGIPAVKGNAQRVEQIVINLLVNACQSLSDKGKSISVSTGYDPESDRAVIRIHDEGEGMSPEVLKRLKDPFFTTKRETGGTGLGLAISERIVADHGGDMVFDSEVGLGTTVTVSIPVQCRAGVETGVLE